MLQELLTALTKTQNSDGGWSSNTPGDSQTETTSLAVMALMAGGSPVYGDAIGSGTAWLKARQMPNGAWSRSDDVPEPNWMTSLAVIALSTNEEDLPKAIMGGIWLLGSPGWAPSPLQRAYMWLKGTPARSRAEDTMRGWPWRPGNSGWVEPTAYALMALRKISRCLPTGTGDEAVHEGERMILSRMCPGGGWNYGNSRVLGEDLFPYPDTTALALMALADLPRNQAIEESLLVLEEMIQTNRSGLSLALASICFRRYGQGSPDLHLDLEAAWEATAFRGETRSIALAALALHEGENPFFGDAPC